MAANPLALGLVYALHMLATVIWIGGLLYQSLFLLPEVQRIKEPELSHALLERLRTRFQPIAWLSLTVLIGTGLIQMAANANYEGLLAIQNTWSIAILLKHIAIALMALIAAYQSFIHFPRLTRALLLRMKSENSLEESSRERTDLGLHRANIIFSILVLLLTAIARTA